MKPVLRIIFPAAAIAIISASVIVILKQPRHVQAKSAPVEDPLPTAISNYSKTFKLNTNPPIWTAPANGRNATN